MSRSKVRIVASIFLLVLVAAADVDADAVDEASVVENRNDARDAANFIDDVEKVDDPVDVDVDADAGVDATTLESRNVESFDNAEVDE